jgi:DNA repair protein RecO (recombination protein O)
MPLRESEAIVLRSYPMGEADRLVSFLSRSAGRMRGVASGAKRPKSRFGSTLEVLSYIKIWYFERETRDLVRISQCELIESYLSAQKDYSAGLAIALVSEVTELVLPEKESSDPVFRLVLTAARALSAGLNVQVIVAYFSLWMVRLAGWLPDLEHCVKCGREFGSDLAREDFSGALKCVDCASGGRSISASSIGLAKRMLATKLQAILDIRPATVDAAGIYNFSLDIVERQGERRLASRKLLEEAP